ncbi:hypothetical protein V6N13_040144 [Hibiscus sabdariffa]
MADNYWNRQQQQQPTPPMLSSGGMLKRHRTDYDPPPSSLHQSHEMHDNLARDDDQECREASTFSGLGRAVAATDLALNGQNVGFGGPFPVDPMSRLGRDTVPLPADASNTLFVEGLPPDSTRREALDIFRPFVGYKEVRLVSKEYKHRGGDPILLCFVDFLSPACAATAMSALQGYKIDEHDPDSNYLRLQFSRNPGPRSGGSGVRERR